MYVHRQCFFSFLRLNKAVEGFVIYSNEMALELNRSTRKAMVKAGCNLASHGYRWWDYAYVTEEVERDRINRAVEVHKTIIWERPVGKY